MSRSVFNTNVEEAKKSGWEILKPLNCQVVGKAVFVDKKNKTTIMKSTKKFEVETGWIYNTSTEYRIGNKVSVAEALTFVPRLVDGHQ